MRRRTRTLGTAVIAASFVGLMACGGGDAGDSGQMEAGEEAGGQAAAEAGQMETSDTTHAHEADRPVDVTLAPKNESGIEGMARLHSHGDTLHVTVRLSGLSSGNSYPVHIHEGTCEKGGGVAAGLTSVSATDSTGRSETTVPASKLSMDGSYFVQAHLPDGAPAACGDVPGHGGSSASDTAGSGGGG